MAWARLDDGFLDNRKAKKAGKDAALFYIAGLLHCNKNLTDGFVEDCYLSRIGEMSFQRNQNKIAEKLVEVGLWIKVSGGYLINDYLDYNLSKEQILKKRESGSQGGLAKSLANAKAHAIANGKANALPIYPSPISHKKEDKKASSFLDDDDHFDISKANSFAIYQHLFGSLTKKDSELIIGLENEYSEFAVLHAMKEAYFNDAQRMSYVTAILRNWRAENKLPVEETDDEGGRWITEPSGAERWVAND